MARTRKNHQMSQPVRDPRNQPRANGVVQSARLPPCASKSRIFHKPDAEIRGTLMKNLHVQSAHSRFCGMELTDETLLSCKSASLPHARGMHRGRRSRAFDHHPDLPSDLPGSHPKLTTHGLDLLAGGSAL